MTGRAPPLLRTLAVALGLVVLVAAAEVPSDATGVRPLTVGARAPAVTVRTEHGADFAIDPAAFTRPVILVFYRGGWCPYCNVHLGELAKAEDELEALDFDLYFLSTDRPAILRSSLKDPEVPFTLLSDARMTAARAYGVAFRVDDATYARYKSMGLDLEAASGESHHELPVPAVFILDAGGVVRFLHADPDYKVRLAAGPLLDAARAVAATDAMR